MQNMLEAVSSRIENKFFADSINIKDHKINENKTGRRNEIESAR